MEWGKRKDQSLLNQTVNRIREDAGKAGSALGMGGWGWREEKRGKEEKRRKRKKRTFPVVPTSRVVRWRIAYVDEIQHDMDHVHSVSHSHVSIAAAHFVSSFVLPSAFLSDSPRSRPRLPRFSAGPRGRSAISCRSHCPRVMMSSLRGKRTGANSHRVASPLAGLSCAAGNNWWRAKLNP